MNQTIGTLRETTDFEREVFLYLNDLRESGIVNMYGAGSYIQTNFLVDKQEARSLLKLWLQNFDSEGDYQNVYQKQSEYLRNQETNSIK